MDPPEPADSPLRVFLCRSRARCRPLFAQGPPDAGHIKCEWISLAEFPEIALEPFLASLWHAADRGSVCRVGRVGHRTVLPLGAAQLPRHARVAQHASAGAVRLASVEKLEAAGGLCQTQD